jgi:hypothetical protein
MFDSISKGLKSLGLVEDDKPKQVAPAQGNTPAVQSAQAAATQGTGTALAAQGILDVQSITADIEHDIQNSEAYKLYLAFETHVKKLEEVPNMAEVTRFITAKVTLGTDAEQLVSSLESYGVVLANAASRFEAEFIATSKNDIAKTVQWIAEKDAKIKELTEQLDLAVKDRASLVEAQQQKTVDLGKAEVDFKGITTMLDTKYQGMISKVHAYLDPKQEQGAANAK